MADRGFCSRIDCRPSNADLRSPRFPDDRQRRTPMRGSSTTVVHADREHDEAGIAPAIHQTAAFASASDTEFSAAATAPRGERFYTRYGNPNHAQVAQVV